MNPKNNLKKFLASTALTLAFTLSMPTSVLSMEDDKFEKLSNLRRKILANSPKKWFTSTELDLLDHIKDEHKKEREESQKEKKGKFLSRATEEYRKRTNKTELQYKAKKEVAEDEESLMTEADEQERIAMMDENGMDLVEDLKESSAYAFLKLIIDDQNESIEETLILLGSVPELGEKFTFPINALKTRYMKLGSTHYLQSEGMNSEEIKDFRNARGIELNSQGAELNRKKSVANPTRYKTLARIFSNQRRKLINVMKKDDGINVHHKLKADANIARCKKEINDRNILLGDAFVLILLMEGEIKKYFEGADSPADSKRSSLTNSGESSHTRVLENSGEFSLAEEESFIQTSPHLFADDLDQHIAALNGNPYAQYEEGRRAYELWRENGSEFS